jgi:hypothetical protein
VARTRTRLLAFKVPITIDTTLRLSAQRRGVALAVIAREFLAKGMGIDPETVKVLQGSLPLLPLGDA